MSAFGTFGQVNGGLPGTAPNIFIASTVDNLGTITASGYLNDISSRLKQNDVFYINYSDTSAFPLGEAATLGEFYVDISGGNYSLVNALTGLGQAAAKNVTDNTKTYVASVDGAPASYTAGSILLAGDTNGSVGTDSGFNVNNLLRYVSVAVTAAEFNGMYAAPKLIIAAPGANNLLIVDRAELVMTYGSAAFAAGGVVGFQYDSTVHGAGVAATNTQAAADFFQTASTVFPFVGVSGNTVAILPFTTTVNKGLYLSNLTQAFTTGTGSSFVCKVHYRIIATA